MPHLFLGSALVASAGLFWALHLILSPGPLAPDAAALLGIDLLILSAVAAIGLLLSRGRWSLRLARGCLLAQGALALLWPIDLSWGVALTATAASLVAAFGPPLSRSVRRLPSAAGPPDQAVLLVLGLLTLPALVAAVSPEGLGPARWLLAVAAPGIGWLYARARSIGLWVARLLPLFSLPALVEDLLAGVVLAVAAALLAGLAWTAPARLAVIPLAPRRVEPVPIPPELVPPEVLEAAGLDREGRRRW